MIITRNNSTKQLCCTTLLCTTENVLPLPKSGGKILESEVYYSFSLILGNTVSN